MKIHLFAITWNEEKMLDFFFRHYSWVDHFTFFDDGSDDGTLALLRARQNVEIRPFPRAFPKSFVLSELALHNECWKQSRGAADWVIVTDIDEHLFHPADQMRNYLELCMQSGVTFIPALGYEMLTDVFPESGEHLAYTRTFGSPTDVYSKLRVFDPVALDEVNFTVGGHHANPIGRLVLPNKDELVLLHYKHLGVSHLRSRQEALGDRLKEDDLKSGWGYQYFLDYDHQAARIAELKQTLVDIADPGYSPATLHREPRWWRGEEKHISTTA